MRKNLRFDMKYYGKKMTIDEIINNKIGVAEHYSILYNALLHSVNIPSIYIAGYVFDEPSDHTNLQTSRHAWNIVRINNKWVPIDSIMKFFMGNYLLVMFLKVIFKMEFYILLLIEMLELKIIIPLN